VIPNDGDVLELLRDLEWSYRHDQEGPWVEGGPTYDTFCLCPICHGEKPTHADGCRLEKKIQQIDRCMK